MLWTHAFFVSFSSIRVDLSSVWVRCGEMCCSGGSSFFYFRYLSYCFCSCVALCSQHLILQFVLSGCRFILSHDALISIKYLALRYRLQHNSFIFMLFTRLLHAHFSHTARCLSSWNRCLTVNGSAFGICMIFVLGLFFFVWPFALERELGTVYTVALGLGFNMFCTFFPLILLICYKL